MKINLQLLIDIESSQLRIDERTDKDINKCVFLNIVPKFHENIIKKILLSVPIPKINIYEITSNQYEVLSNKEYIEAILYVKENKHKIEPKHLVRKIEECQIPLIIYYSFMDKKIINQLIE